MVSNLYLKFSELQLLEGDDKPFGSLYGATSSAVLTEFLSPQEIIDMPEEELLPSLRGRAGTASLTYQNFGTPAQGQGFLPVRQVHV